MCAHRTPFGPLPPAAPASSDNLERVVVSRRVTATLHRHLFPRPAPQLGLLFGHVRKDTLTLAVAMRGAWPSLSPHDPFDVDERVLLGASEALAFLSGGHLQWCGIWYLHADAQLGQFDRDVRPIRRAVRRGLCDDRRVMMVAGWQDSLLHLRCSLGSPSSETVDLPVELHTC